MKKVILKNGKLEKSKKRNHSSRLGKLKDIQQRDLNKEFIIHKVLNLCLISY